MFFWVCNEHCLFVVVLWLVRAKPKVTDKPSLLAAAAAKLLPAVAESKSTVVQRGSGLLSGFNPVLMPFLVCVVIFVILLALVSCCCCIEMRR